jgi:hypothetical protein
VQSQFHAKRVENRKKKWCREVNFSQVPQGVYDKCFALT